LNFDHPILAFQVARIIGTELVLNSLFSSELPDCGFSFASEGEDIHIITQI
jgi:hypothetical protein